MCKSQAIGPVLILILSTSALAQPRPPAQGRDLFSGSILEPGVRPALYYKYRLIDRPLVQVEIKSTPAQQQRWTKAQEDVKPPKEILERAIEYHRRPVDQRDPEIEAALI